MTLEKSLIFTLNISSLSGFASSIIILIFAIFSLIYVKAFRSDKLVMTFFLFQMSLFIYIFSYVMYSSSSNVSTVLFWTRICLFGGASIILTMNNFVESIAGKRNKTMFSIYTAITAFNSLMIFLPGNHFFLKQLNPDSLYSVVLKGPFFPALTFSILIFNGYSLFRLGRFILSDAEKRHMGTPVLIGLIIWFIEIVADTVFCDILLLIPPQVGIGPAAMTISLSFFLARLSKNKQSEIQSVTDEKDLIYENLIHDKQTGVFTREFITQNLIQRIAHQDRSSRKDALLLIDVDNFKLINDSLGHTMGDQVLSLIGRILRHNTRQSDIPARLGGDEFLILFDGCDASGAHVIAEHIREDFVRELSITIKNRKIAKRISLSIGITSSHSWEKTAEDVIHQADLAMYSSKKNGKNKISVYSQEMKFLFEE